jgi:hypothetical protein
MPRPMKLWEVMSAFRDRKDILAKVFGSARWRDDYGEIYQNFYELVSRQDRQVLDAPVPIELSREIAALYPAQFLFYPARGIVREASIDRLPDEQRIEMTALEVHDRFGSSVIEEILERSYAQVRG